MQGSFPINQISGAIPGHQEGAKLTKWTRGNIGGCNSVNAMKWGAVIVPADAESQNEKRGCPETKPNELTAKAVTPPKTCASTNSM